MAVYRFKITFEDQEDVSREIDIRSSQTFEELHYAIQEAIGFDASQPASFYMSNDHWMKGREFSLQERPPHNDETNILMNNAVLRDWISDPHQKFYYVFDYAAQWTFHVELHRIFAADDTRKKYPVCVKITGEAPKQKAVPIIFKAEIEDVPEDELPVLIEDEYSAGAEEDNNDDGEEVIVNPEEADDITDEKELSGESDSEEEETN